MHTIEAYSSWGLTIAKYADVLTSIEQLLRFLLRKFKVLDALPVIFDIIMR